MLQGTSGKSQVERPAEQKHLHSESTGGGEGGAGLSTRTCASAAGRDPHRREPGRMVRLALIPSRCARLLGTSALAAGGPAGSLLPAAAASGSGPAAGEHREPGEEGHGLA
ncbi:uncharacterized protein LOC112610787 [Theropithecus gelada]|uniref:uncharacterized protein LOC112610787 n=1 Tax=Theropithecus gelada TaxID=9565 RepID=UPI000DC185CB|nr:uncharacterized protein LOC112610787 [Theropithecus gelada]